MSVPTADDLPAEVPEPIANLDLSDLPKPEFQFTPAQERLMDELGRKMGLVGLVGMVLGALMLLAVLGDVANRGMVAIGALSVVPVVFLLVGAWTRAAGREFHAVANNPQREVTHLMGALEYQARIFRFASWVLFGLLAVTLVFGVFSLVVTRAN
jgi:hypothetical protein